MAGRTVVRGIVLRAVDTKESDRILTVLTASMGKIAVVAKGARSRRSRVAAATQLLAYSELTLSESHGWQILSEAGTLELFQGLRQDVVLLSLGSYFAELTDAVTGEGLEAGEILSHLLNALYALSSLHLDPRLVKPVFEWKLMALTGFAPLAEGCAVCAREQPEAPMLDVVHGVLHCRSCRQGGGLDMPLTPSALEALRYVLWGNPKRLYAFSLEEEDLRLFHNAAEAYTAAQLERGFRTLDFYKRLCSDLPAAGESEHNL